MRLRGTFDAPRQKAGDATTVISTPAAANGLYLANDLL